MADIRVRARASIGSIYHHFRSKEQLAAALYVEGLRDYQEGAFSPNLTAAAERAMQFSPLCVITCSGSGRIRT